MQPTPTATLLAAASPRLRAWTLSLHASLFLALLALGACRDPKVASYRVPKEAAAELPASKPIHSPGAQAPATATAPTAAAADSAALPPDHPPMGGAKGALPANHPPTGAGDMGSGAGLQTAPDAALVWSAPAEWQAKPASMMRKATYALTGPGGATADLAITAFPGDVGGDVANVNRWRGQVGLAPLGDADAAAAIERLEINGLKIGLVDIVDRAAANPTHLIGAIVPVGNATWFFKLLGPDAAVAPQKEAFVAFVKTIKPTGATTP